MIIPTDEYLKAYKEKSPEIVFEWNDEETGAEGWVVINSLRGGAAGGGTRMRKGLDRREVESLAKIMEIKFAVSGPAIGGAKSGINFDPQDPRKDKVLRKWFKAVIPLLKHYYGTGGDLNIDEMKEVIPITEDYGLWHPQEGIVNGHFHSYENKKIQQIGQLRQGVSKIVEDPAYSPDSSKKIAVADMITGYGVAQSVLHYYDIYHNKNITDKSVIIQGWGNVAASAAYYLAQNGAKIIGIIDRNGGLIEQDGLSFETIRQLFLTREKNQLTAPSLVSFNEANDQIWQLQADIFIPAASSRLVSRDNIQQLMNNGLEVVSCGANVPFIDGDIFYGENAKFVDHSISLIPDFIANCGMARTFAYLMQETATISDEAIFSDVSQNIRETIEKVHSTNREPINLTKTALQIALQKLISTQQENVGTLDSSVS
jgi:glutamate dehydrogenase/leucine dehydrogenase